MLVNRITSASLRCDRSELAALINITLANALDQAQHLPERYDERKLLSLQFLLPLVPRSGAQAFHERLRLRAASTVMQPTAG